VLVVIALLFLCVGLGFLFPINSVARQILTNALLFEFALGAVAGAVCLKLYAAMRLEVRHALAKACVYVGAILFVISVTVHGEDSARLLIYGMPSFCVVMGAALWRERVYHPYLVFLGDASYSIYLIHGIGVMVFTSLLRRGGLLQRVPLDLLIAVGTLVMVPLCALGFTVVERPLLRAMRLVGVRRTDSREPCVTVNTAVG
jgi:exopolysaccharide production protein ExoZ